MDKGFTIVVSNSNNRERIKKLLEDDSRFSDTDITVSEFCPENKAILLENSDLTAPLSITLPIEIPETNALSIEETSIDGCCTVSISAKEPSKRKKKKPVYRNGIKINPWESDSFSK